MDQQGREQAFQTALSTELFVLQMAASATIAEGSSRSTLYLLSLSSSLVALGFAGQVGDPATFAAAVLPTVFGLGWFTVVRLVDVSIENLGWLNRVARIRAYYAALLPEAEAFFAGAGNADAGDQRGHRSPRFMLWFTMASMIGAVNSVVGGASVALLLHAALHAPTPLALASGGAVATALFASMLAYQRHRFATEVAPADPG